MQDNHIRLKPPADTPFVDCPAPRSFVYWRWVSPSSCYAFARTKAIPFSVCGSGTEALFLRNDFMRLFLSLLLATALGGVTPTNAQECDNADPSRVTVEVTGDFELTVDPTDSEQHLILVNHVANGPSNVVVARMDGITGQIEAGTLTTIAKNFQGQRMHNGPEFVLPPGSGLGVLYRALDGVHGVFRPAAPKAWNDFSVDIDGNAIAKGGPPRLVSSYRGSYEGGGMLFGQNTYSLALGPCTKLCFANMRSGVPTDLVRVLLREQKLTVQTVVQGTRDGTVYVLACTKGAAANGTCGIYEATIDGAGGIVAGSLQMLVTLQPRVGPVPRQVAMVAARHPATGTTIIFLGAVHESGRVIEAYEQRVDGGALTQVASVPVYYSDHFRAVDDGKMLVLHNIIREGMYSGSYALTLMASDGHFQASQAKRIADAAGGAEVAYLPRAGRFAIYYRTSLHPNKMQRCFFDP